MGRVNSSPVKEQFQDNGSAAQGHKCAYYNGRIDLRSCIEGHHCHKKCSYHDLKQATDKNAFFQSKDFFQWKFKTNGKEKEDDAYFSKNFNKVNIFYKFQSIRAKKHTGRQKTYQGGYF